ncbi:MAG: YddF family protein [Clostridiales bacterium]
MKKLAILNTTIITNDGDYSLKTISLEEAKKLVSESEILSAVGHNSTAQILTSLLDVEIPVNRILFSQEKEQQALCFKLNGRPPEGEILSKEDLEKIGYSFKLLVRTV